MAEPDPGGLSRAEVKDLFVAGYRDAGGPEEVLAHMVDDVIGCESSWNVDPPGVHLGLAQFDAGTWRTARRSPDADYRSPYEQGYAVATWLRLIGLEAAGTRSGWPHCYWVGGGA